MKQLIMDVLEDMSTGQINLASAAARKTVANTIVAAIKTNKKGWFLDLSSDKYGKPKLTEEELETQRYKEYWTCDICGKDTSGVDYDYIGSGTNHLGCELKSQEEIDEYIEDIDEQAYAQGRKSSYIQGSEEIDGMYTDEEVKGWEEAVGYKEETKFDPEKKYIFESPDGGETVYRREFGSDERVEIKIQEMEK